jgi:hypothetical protein
MTDDWQLIVPKIEEPKEEAPPEPVELPPTVEAETKTVNVEETQPSPPEAVLQETNTIADIEAPKEAKTEESPTQTFQAQQTQEVPMIPAELAITAKATEPKKLKATRKTAAKKKTAKRRKKTEKVEKQKQKTSA